MSYWTDSGISSRYGAYRPKYPTEAFDHIVKTLRDHGSQFRTVVDVGCGTGQALAPFLGSFGRCIGVDSSKTQVAECSKYLEEQSTKLGKAADVVTTVGTASNFNLPDGANDVDLVVVGQAMHWFDMKAFGRELDRTLRPGGFLAVLIYTTPRLHPEQCDEKLQELDKFLMANEFWPKERKHIDNEYESLIPQLPYPLLSKTAFDPVEERTVASVVNYVSTWSGMNQYIAKSGHKTRLAELQADLTAAKGEGRLSLRLPVKLFMFRRPLVAKL